MTSDSGLPPAHPAVLSGGAVDWSALTRVLLVRMDNLGDVILSTPLLRALRASLAAGARLDLLASPGGVALAPVLPHVDEVHGWRAPWQDASGALPVDPVREAGLTALLRGYDAVVISTSFSQSPWPAAYAAYLAGVPVRVGQSQEFGGSVLSSWVLPGPDDHSAHQVDRGLRMLAAAGVPDQGRRLELVVPPAADLRAAEALGERDARPLVLLAPGASAPARRYPRFADAVTGLREAGTRVVVVGTEAERALVAEVSGGVDALVGMLDVPALVAALARADAVVTNNSGSMHIADAVGTPSVVLFAGTETIGQYAPRSAQATVLTRPTGCSPCRAFTCPYAQECLDIEPAEVVGATLAMLAGGRAHRVGADRVGAGTAAEVAA